LGVRAAVQAWRHRGDAEKDETVKPAGPRIMEVAALSFGGAFRSS
jgi:hypothetical protein